tara:strand:+ start:166 stop:384 length:219 start_codon:yes stop_codon:yes gene_type:complete
MVLMILFIAVVASCHNLSSFSGIAKADYRPLQNFAVTGKAITRIEFELRRSVRPTLTSLNLGLLWFREYFIV